MNSSSSQFSDASRPELSRVLRTAILHLVRSLLLYIILFHSSWPFICWSCRSLLEYLSHPALSLTCCKLQWTRWHCLWVIPLLMRSDCQLRTFNAEVTASSTIAPPPCPHSCPPVFVLLFGTTGRVAMDGVPLFPSMTPACRGQDGPRQLLLATLGLPYSFSDVFPSSNWALGLIFKWAEVPRSLGPAVFYFHLFSLHLSLNTTVVGPSSKEALHKEKSFINDIETLWTQNNKGSSLFWSCSASHQQSINQYLEPLTCWGFQTQGIIMKEQNEYNKGVGPVNSAGIHWKALSTAYLLVKR